MIVQIDSEKFRKQIEQAKDWNEDDDFCWNAALELAERAFWNSAAPGLHEVYVYAKTKNLPFPMGESLVRIEKTDFGDHREFYRELLIYAKKLSDADVENSGLTYLGKRTTSYDSSAIEVVGPNEEAPAAVNAPNANA